MKLPSADRAIVPLRKVTSYLLSDSHPQGRTKAAFFRGLGFRRDRPAELQRALLQLALTSDAYHDGLDIAGESAASNAGHRLSGLRRFAMKTGMLRELDLAALQHDLPSYGLIAGDVGTVVLVYGAGEAYEVEFLTGDGRTLAVETLRADEVEPVAGQQVLHARKLARG